MGLLPVCVRWEKYNYCLIKSQFHQPLCGNWPVWQLEDRRCCRQSNRMTANTELVIFQVEDTSLNRSMQIPPRCLPVPYQWEQNLSLLRCSWLFQCEDVQATCRLQLVLLPPSGRVNKYKLTPKTYVAVPCLSCLKIHWSVHLTVPSESEKRRPKGAAKRQFCNIMRLQQRTYGAAHHRFNFGQMDAVDKKKKEKKWELLLVFSCYACQEMLKEDNSVHKLPKTLVYVSSWRM